jgi:hypothetical protein
MPFRQDVSAMSQVKRHALRALLDTYIRDKHPVAEHHKADMDATLDIHGRGFLAWHQHFVAELENWLVMNNGAQFVPLPFWDPGNPVPPELNKNNTDVNMPLPAQFQGAALAAFPDYDAINTAILPFHNNVHNNLGGDMPNPHKSPGDPIFWPFHALLVAVYERWRGL